MDYEKKYKEALERAKKLTSDMTTLQKIREFIFPELAESEDEKTRKSLLAYIKGESNRLDKPKWIAYLEKQKEQKPVDIDYISGIREELLGIEDSAKDIDGLTESQWVAIRAAHRLLGEYIEKEQKPIEPSDDELERHQNELYDFKVFAAKQAREHHISFVHDFEWNNFCAELLSYFHERKSVSYSPLCNTVKDKIREYVANNFVLDTVVKTDVKSIVKAMEEGVRLGKEEQKPWEWSEGDEKMIDTIVSVLGQYIDYKAVSGTGSGYATPRYTKEIEWLKSLSSNLEKKNEDVAKLCSNEWSEEDEEMRNLIIAIFEVNHPNAFFKANELGTTDMRGVHTEEIISWLKSLRPQPKKELSIEKAIQWLDDTFYFMDNSSGRGRDCEITTHDFDSLEEMYDSFRKAVTVDSKPHWKPSEEDIKMLEHIIGQYETGNKNSKVMGYLPRVEELDFLKKVLAKWKNLL